MEETHYSVDFQTQSGNHSTLSTTRYLFTSREFDTATRLQYNRARYYDPSVGRWLSEDPLGFTAGDANVGRYAGNQITAAADPSGLSSFWSDYVHYWRSNLDGLQLWLDGAGCIPAAGEPFDVVNAGISLCRGNVRDAALSGISVIPVIGDAVGKGGKVGVFIIKKGDDVVGAVGGAVKHLDDLPVGCIDDVVESGGKLIDDVPARPDIRRPGTTRNLDGTLTNPVDQVDQINRAQDLNRRDGGDAIHSTEKSQQIMKKYLDGVRNGRVDPD